METSTMSKQGLVHHVFLVWGMWRKEQSKCLHIRKMRQNRIHHDIFAKAV